jgi:hypothetical protein
MNDQCFLRFTTIEVIRHILAVESLRLSGMEGIQAKIQLILSRHLTFSPSGSPLVPGRQELPSKPVTEPNRPVFPSFNIDESALESLLQERSVSSGVEEYHAMTLSGGNGRGPPPPPLTLQPSAIPQSTTPAQNPPAQPSVNSPVTNPAKNPPADPSVPDGNVSALDQLQNAAPGASVTFPAKTEEHSTTEEHSFEVILTPSDTN